MPSGSYPLNDSPSRNDDTCAGRSMRCDADRLTLVLLPTVSVPPSAERSSPRLAPSDFAVSPLIRRGSPDSSSEIVVISSASGNAASAEIRSPPPNGYTTVRGALAGTTASKNGFATALYRSWYFFIVAPIFLQCASTIFVRAASTGAVPPHATSR